MLPGRTGPVRAQTRVPPPPIYREYRVIVGELVPTTILGCCRGPSMPLSNRDGGGVGGLLRETPQGCIT